MARRTKPQHNQKHHHQQPVQPPNVNLPAFSLGGIGNRHTRQKSQAGRLLRDRKRARYCSLRCDYRGRSCQRNEWQSPVARHQEVKGVFHRIWRTQHQCTLAHIVKHQCWQYHCEPRDANGVAAEVAHIGVKRFAAGQSKEPRAERKKRERGRRHGEVECVHGVQCPQNRR